MKDEEEMNVRQFGYDIRWKQLLALTKGFAGSRAILQEPSLTCQARVLFHIIASYASSGEGFCCASINTLGTKMGLSRTSVKTYIRELEERKFIARIHRDTGYGPRLHIYINFTVLLKYYTPN
jgi:hypothetical protein